MFTEYMEIMNFFSECSCTEFCELHFAQCHTRYRGMKFAEINTKIYSCANIDLGNMYVRHFLKRYC